jgi:hypothetical protein
MDPKLFACSDQEFNYGSGSGSKSSRFPTYGTVAISIKENRFKELPYVFFLFKI